MLGIDPNQGPWQFMSRSEKIFMYTVATIVFPIVLIERWRKK